MNPMIAQLKSLPELVRKIVPAYSDNIKATLTPEISHSFDHLYLMGCGDSHHVSIASQLAFRTLSGIETEALTAMHFARYTSDTLQNPERCLVAGASVSGEVSRTLEGMLLARKAGAKVLALTASPQSRIGRAADWIVDTTQPKFNDPEGLIIPGVRSYVANQIGLYLIAIHLGEQREKLSAEVSENLRKQLFDLGDKIQETIDLNEEKTMRFAKEWIDETEFVFCGSGPAYAAALFSAAKILESCGDSAIGQDLEEWAHLQYFEKRVTTPTFIISAGERDRSRAIEVAVAAETIGRRVAVVSPEAKLDIFPSEVIKFALADGVHEIFQAVLSMIPGSLFAAQRAELLAEPYFRDFGGGRSKEGGGGISRIRTGETLGLGYLKEE